MRDAFTFLGMVWVMSLLLGGLGRAVRAIVHRLRTRRAIKLVMFESHRWDRWAKYHAENRP